MHSNQFSISAINHSIQQLGQRGMQAITAANGHVAGWLKNLSTGKAANLAKANLTQPNVRQLVLATLPYAPILTIPTLFGKVIPNEVTRYRRNLDNRQFTAEYAAYVDHFNPENLGRLMQGYYNYEDKYGVAPGIVTNRFLNQEGPNLHWSAATTPVEQLTEARVVMPPNPQLARHYPTLFMG